MRRRQSIEGIGMPSAVDHLDPRHQSLNLYIFIYKDDVCTKPCFLEEYSASHLWET